MIRRLRSRAPSSFRSPPRRAGHLPAMVATTALLSACGSPPGEDLSLGQLESAVSLADAAGAARGLPGEIVRIAEESVGVADKFVRVAAKPGCLAESSAFLLKREVASVPAQLPQVVEERVGSEVQSASRAGGAPIPKAPRLVRASPGRAFAPLLAPEKANSALLQRRAEDLALKVRPESRLLELKPLRPAVRPLEVALRDERACPSGPQRLLLGRALASSAGVVNCQYTPRPGAGCVTQQAALGELEAVESVGQPIADPPLVRTMRALVAPALVPPKSGLLPLVPRLPPGFVPSAPEQPLLATNGPRFTWEELSALSGDLRDAVGWVEPPVWEKAQKHVRVAVIDTEIGHDLHQREQASGFRAPTPHGHAVALTIENLNCMPNEPCGVEVVNYSALPADGGLGRLSDLALAIHRAVVDWADEGLAPPARAPLVRSAVPLFGSLRRKTRAPEQQPRQLVLNLSLGWSPHVTGQSQGRDLVELALREAHCHGALVIGAAGNALSGDETGPVYPALWQTRESPDPASASCDEMRSTSEQIGQLLRPAQERSRKRADLLGARRAARPYSVPLVYAVSAVDFEGVPLAITRSYDAELDLGGLAPRAAAGLSFVTEESDWGGVPTTSVLSGSSMATAVVSAVAARLIATELEERGRLLTGAEVFQRIDQSLERSPHEAAAQYPNLCGPTDDCRSPFGVVRMCRALGEDCPAWPANPFQPLARGAAAPAKLGPEAALTARLRVANGRRSDEEEGIVRAQPGPAGCHRCRLDFYPDAGKAILELSTTSQLHNVYLDTWQGAEIVQYEIDLRATLPLHAADGRNLFELSFLRDVPFAVSVLGQQAGAGGLRLEPIPLSVLSGHPQ